MENDGLHYVNRDGGSNEKMYDELDLEIGIFIKEKRSERWKLNDIFNELGKRFELRKPPQQKPPSKNRKADRPSSELMPLTENNHAAEFKQEVLSEILSSIEQAAASRMEELKIRYENMMNHVQPFMPDEEDLKEKQWRDMVLQKRVEYQLEKEALLLWTAKPLHERQKKIGWFRKEEDLTKRDIFVKEYVNRHFPDGCEIMYSVIDSHTEQSGHLPESENEHTANEWKALYRIGLFLFCKKMVANQSIKFHKMDKFIR